jgi:DNA-binding transcriptional MerR regulator
VADRLIPIGELARRTGVAVTALRYYDELCLVRPKSRASGQRRYAESAIREVGVVLFLRDVGFSLAEVAEMVAAGSRTVLWSSLVERKLGEVAEQERRLLAARTALEHSRDCLAKNPSRCPRFWSIIDARLSGESLEDSHATVHEGEPETLGAESA